MDTLSGEDREEEKLGRQPEQDEWAYAKQEAGYWMKGPDLPSGPIAREMVLSLFRDKDNWFKGDDGYAYVDMTAVAPYMDKVFALYTPEGEVFDTVRPRETRQN